jgi:hypothetical protein
MPCSPEQMKKLDAMIDSAFKDAFEEAHHPRNAGGVFTTGEGEEAKEDSKKKQDTQDEPGNLGKKNAS